MRACYATGAIAVIVSSVALAAFGCASDDRVEATAHVRQKTIDTASGDAEYGQPDFVTSVAQPPDHGLNAPRGLSIDPRGSFPDNVYVADTSNHRMFAVDAGLAARVDTTLFGQSSWSSSSPDGGGLVNSVHVDGPTFLAFASDQWLLADTNNHRVLFGSTGGFFASWVFGQGGDFNTNVPNKGGLGSGSLLSPTGVTFLAQFRGYVISDTGNNRVVVYTFSTSAANWVIGQSDFTVNLPNRGVAVASNGLNDPRGVTRASPYDPTQIADPRLDGIYVVDRGNNRILHFKWTPGFEGGDFPSTTADDVYGQVDFASGDAGVGPDRLSAPTAIAIDPNNGFWVADTGNHRVLHFPYPSHVADKVIGQPDFVHHDAPTSTSPTTLSSPEGVAVAPNGDLYVSDTGANRILKYAFGPADSCDDGDPCTNDELGGTRCEHLLVTDSKECFPYECDTNRHVCITDCRTLPPSPSPSGGSCQAPFICIGSRCLKQCHEGSTGCEVGYCSDGVCCDSPCTGTCEACTVPGFEGQCHSFSGNPATFKTSARCASPTGDVECAGQCDGLNGDVCAPTAAGTHCGANFCKDGVASRGGSCDGKGSCVAAATDCYPYACGAVACRTVCSGDDQCGDGATCSSGVCISASSAYAPVGGSCVASRSTYVRVDRWALVALASLVIVARRRRKRAS